MARLGRGRSAQATALAVVLTACGAAPTSGPTATSSTSTPPATTASETGAPRQTEACAQDRAAILAAMTSSRDAAACVTPTDCAVVTGPGHPDPEFAEVVAARDASSLDARAEAHLAACGAFHHHEAIDAFRVVEAACTAGRCTADETTFHITE